MSLPSWRFLPSLAWVILLGMIALAPTGLQAGDETEGAGESEEEEDEEEEEESGGDDESGGGDSPSGGDGPPGGGTSPPDDPNKPVIIPRRTEQTGIKKDVFVFQHDKEPYFEVVIPKLKTPNSREKWVLIDVDERVESEIELIQPFIEKEQGKETPNQQLIDELNQRIQKIRQDNAKLKCIVETKADSHVAPGKNPFQGMQSIRVNVETATKDMKAGELSPKQGIQSQGWQITTLIADKDITPKPDASKGKFTYHFEAVLTGPDGTKLWYRNVAMLIYNKKGTTRFLIRYAHEAPYDAYNADQKAFMLEAEAFRQSFRVRG